VETSPTRVRWRLTVEAAGPRPGPSRRLVVAAGRADLHVHSHWSDGAQSPERIVRAAAGRLDVVALTDHDEIRGAVRARDCAAVHPELGVDVVIGEEISTLNGHLIGLWLEEAVPPGLPALRTIELVHAQGGAAIADGGGADARARGVVLDGRQAAPALPHAAARDGPLPSSLPAAHGHGDRAVNPTSIARRPR
jgi:hypothetical protein